MNVYNVGRWSGKPSLVVMMSEVLDSQKTTFNESSH